MNQTPENNIVGNFRISVGGVVVTFNIMDNPEAIATDLAKAVAVCENTLMYLSPANQLAGAAKKAAEGVAAAAKATAAVAKTAEKISHATADETPAKADDGNVAASATLVSSNVASTPVVEMQYDAPEPPIEVVDAEQVYTLADIRAQVTTIVDMGKRTAAEAYVQFHHKTKRLSDIPAEKYPAVMADFSDLAAGLRAGTYNGYDDFAKVKGYELSSNGQE